MITFSLSPHCGRWLEKFNFHVLLMVISILNIEEVKLLHRIYMSYNILVATTGNTASHAYTFGNLTTCKGRLGFYDHV